MTTNPDNLYEAHALLIGALLANLPHNIRYEADERDWEQRITHLQGLGNALDGYLKELGKDCAQHARNSFDMRAFTDPVSDALSDALGEMERAMEAAREHNSLPAE